MAALFYAIIKSDIILHRVGTPKVLALFLNKLKERSINMKNIRLFFIIIIVLISSFPISNLVNSIIAQEKIETWLGILGLFTTFGGAYLGAKIAGSESRKLFKQEIKMNDLQQHMDVNISILKDIQKVRDSMENLETQLESFQSGNFLSIEYGFTEMQRHLDMIDEKRLIDSSIIVSHDVFELKKTINNQSDVFEYFMNEEKIEELISRFLEEELMGPCHMSNDKIIYERRNNPRDSFYEGEIEEIPITDLILQNKKYFNEEYKKLTNSMNQIKNTYNNMTYKNISEIKNSFVKIYKE